MYIFHTYTNASTSTDVGTCMDVGTCTYVGTSESIGASSWKVRTCVHRNHSCGQLWRNYKIWNFWFKKKIDRKKGEINYGEILKFQNIDLHKKKIWAKNC